MAEDKKKRGPGRPPGSKNKSKKSASTSNNKRSSSNAENAEQKQIREMQEKRNSHRKLIDEIWGIAIFAIGVFLIFTMKSDSTGSFGHGIHNILRNMFYKCGELFCSKCNEEIYKDVYDIIKNLEYKALIDLEVSQDFERNIEILNKYIDVNNIIFYDKNKKVTKIMIFYSDNTFETFSPDNE